MVIASHWPSRRQGRWRSEPLRIAVAENIAYLVRDHVRFDARDVLALRDAGDLAAVQQRWETPVLVMGDFNDEPCDRSLVDHLQASSELDRVAGPTNDIDGFAAEAADLPRDDTFLYNPCWRFLGAGEHGHVLPRSAPPGESFANRYQVLDQMVASRGLLGADGPAARRRQRRHPRHEHRGHADPAARAASTARRSRARPTTCR